MVAPNRPVPINSPVANFSLQTLGAAAVGAIVAPTIGVSAVAGACICAVTSILNRIAMAVLTGLGETFPPVNGTPSFPTAAFSSIRALACVFAGAAAASALGLGIVTIPHALFVSIVGVFPGQAVGAHIYQFLGL